MNRARAATFPSSRVGVVPVRGCWGLRPVHPSPHPPARARGRRRSAAPLSYLEAQEIHPALPALGPRTALLPPPLGRATSRSASLLLGGFSERGFPRVAGKFREILAEASSFGPGERCTREPSGAPARLLVNVENGNGNVHERKQLIRAAPPHGLGLGLRQRRLDRHDRHGRCRPWLWHVVFSVRLLVYPCIFFLRVCENVREKAHKVTQRLALLRKKDRWAG